jgi:hypothetical protein
MPKTTTAIKTIEAEIVSGSLSIPTNALHNQYHRCAQAAAGMATGYAILCGLELQKIRAEVAKPGKRSDLTHAGAGGWEAWVESNCEFSIRTAQKYMAVAEGVKGKILQTELSKSLAIMCNVAPSALTDGNREKLLKSVSKVTEGQTLQQLYMDFGITKADPRANLKKGGATHTKGRGPSKNVDAQLAHDEAADILQRLAKWLQSGQHQLLNLSDLKHLDDQLLDARETIKPFLKAKK